MFLMNTSTQLLVMAPLVGIPRSSCYSRGSNNTNFCTGLYKLVGNLLGRPLWSKLLSAILTRTFLTRPTSSGSTSSTRAIFQQFRGISLSIIMAMSSSWRLLRLVCHFFLGWSDWMYSFLHLVQNSLARNCTLRHRFLEYISACWNSPGGGSISFYFMVRRWLGVRASGICGEFKVSTVNGRQFTIAWASVMKVLRASSSSWAACRARSDASTFRTERIWRSQAPPIWLASGTFILKSSQSQLVFTNSCCILLWSIMDSASCSSFLAPTKFVPWSDRNWRTGPRRPTNWR